MNIESYLKYSLMLCQEDNHKYFYEVEKLRNRIYFLENTITNLGDSTMTKKHFKLIADVIAKANLNPTDKVALANEFAVICAGCNPNFNKDKFITACLSED